MKPELKAAIKNFISNGGGYVGFCAGAFFTTKYVGLTNTAGLNIVSGTTQEYFPKYLNGQFNPKYADGLLFDISWRSKVVSLYFSKGPFFNIDRTDQKVSVLAYYPTGHAAALFSTYGKGRIAITGLHPEAPQSWRDIYKLKDRDGSDYPYAVELIRLATSKP